MSQFLQDPVKAIVIGAGARGSVYSNYALDFPDKFKDPAVAFAKMGYHVLLEKPMAVSYADCKEIVEACRAAGVMLAVCHVLRYTPQARKITELVRSGAIGDVINIQHTENIGYWHFAHSYVRGNWRNCDTSTFALLAKSCHDLDLIQMWMGNERCVSISSFGSLKHFTASNKPAAMTGTRCVDCSIEPSCSYSAKRLYLGRVNSGDPGWPVDIIAEIPDIESVTNAITNGPYGRCVYGCDNNVVDNQVVIMQFEGGATVSFTMVAFTERVGDRIIKIYGSKGELTCDFTNRQILQFDFHQHKTLIHDVTPECSSYKTTRLTGQGGADFFTIEAFVKAIAGMLTYEAFSCIMRFVVGCMAS